MNSTNRIAATLLPRDKVCLRNISINTLHKGDDDENININKSGKIGEFQVLLTIPTSGDCIHT
jgi:hypothetical protein